MKTEIETAIKLLAEKVEKETPAIDALQFTQAALNLAHTAQVIEVLEFEMNCRRKA